MTPCWIGRETSQLSLPQPPPNLLLPQSIPLQRFASMLSYPCCPQFWMQHLTSYWQECEDPVLIEMDNLPPQNVRNDLENEADTASEYTERSEFSERSDSQMSITTKSQDTETWWRSSPTTTRRRDKQQEVLLPSNKLVCKYRGIRLTSGLSFPSSFPLLLSSLLSSQNRRQKYLCYFVTVHKRNCPKRR